MDGKKSVIVDSESLADSDVEKQASAAAIQYRRQARQEDAASDELETLAVPSTPKSKSGLEAPIAAEYRTSTKTKYLFLGLYFSLSLILTIYSKAVLGKFAYPWLLTTLHTASASVGCYVLMMRGHYKLTHLTTRENMQLIMFSFLFTINIAVSNISLAMVSVPFHQTMRSACPIVTVLIYRLHYARTYPTATYLSLIPIIGGVALATYGDYYFTAMGFLFTILGIVLASLKTIVTNRLMTGSLALTPLELLFRMSPLAAAQSLVFAVLTGETKAFLAYVAEGHLTPTYSFALIGNGVLAFSLNVASFYTNRVAGALTITVCANLKQCLTVLLGILVFQVKVGVLNGYGMIISLLGAAVYSKVELNSKGYV